MEISARITSLFLFILAIIVRETIDSAFNQYSFELNITEFTFLLIFIFVCLLNFVKKFLNRIVLISWYIYYLCGVVFLNASALNDSKLNIDNSSPDQFYFLSLIALTIGILFHENFSQNVNHVSIPKKEEIPTIITVIFFTYPVALIYSIYTNLGFIPLIAGKDFTTEMYTSDYGVIYNYKFLIGFSILLCLYFYLASKKYVYIILYIAFSFISLLDGRRVIVMITIMSTLVMYTLYKSRYGKINYKVLLILPVVLILIYSSATVFRGAAGADISSIDLLLKNFPIGVEYTDYAYSFETYEPGNIKGYSFIKSAVGSFTNSSVLSLLGFDKNELVQSGSAYIWMREYGIEFGIRTGIISELYFDYGYFTILIMFLMGLFFSYVNKNIMTATNTLNFLLLCLVFSYNVLSIVGQIDVYFGAMLMLIYLKILFYIINKISQKKPKNIITA
ncbi:hypothetical protein GCM10027578_05960 [Spirosoma luteolum]